MFFYGNCIISWQSLKQKVMAMSSCEAEYISTTTTTCQGVWLDRFLSELKKERPACFPLWMDNKSAISLTKNPVFHEQTH